jgi:hypothetical protein
MTAPSVHYTQHYAVDEPLIDRGVFRPFWRRRSRLDALLLDGTLSPGEWRTAHNLRSIIEAVRSTSMPVHAWDRAGGGGSSDDALSRRVDAMAQLAAIRSAIGSFAVTILEAVIVDDVSWAALGAFWNVHPKTARRWTVTSLRALGSRHRYDSRSSI